MHGWGHLYESCLQIRGEAGARQVEDAESAEPEEAEHLVAEEGGEDWCEAVDEHEQREEPGSGNAGMQIAHDGTRDDYAGCPGNALYEAERNTASTQLGGLKPTALAPS